MIKNTLSRIKEYIDFKGINNASFEKEVGMSNGSFASQLKNNKTIGVDKLENILKKYPEINPDWLLTGKGSMLKEEQKSRLSQNITGNSNIQSGNDTNTGDCKAQIKRLEAQLRECEKNSRDKDQVIKEQSTTIYTLINKK
jgi:hypothetical protein